jgi:hypothetical protein
MNNRILRIFLVLLILSPLRAQESQDRFSSSCSVNWAKGEINAQVHFNLASEGIKLPVGRFMAEEILDESYPALLRPYLFPLKVDSSSTVHSLIGNGELSLDDLDTISSGAVKIPPNISTDFTRMTGRYTVFTEKFSAFLLRHRIAREPSKPLIPSSTAEYTGIIIIAEQELPVRGRRARVLAEPCLFPKIWDTNMELIYERTMFKSGREAGNRMVRYALPESIFRPTPSGLDDDLAALAGNYPLRILAREVFGINPTDLVIDRDDAVKILSTENNRRLLTEGKVVFVLNKEKLMY